MATEQTLPSSTALQDLLATQKKDSSFGARKKMYSDLGFDKRLGYYQGSPNQDLTLIKQLQTETPKPVQPATDILSLAGNIPASYDTSKMTFGTNPDVLVALQPPGGMTKVPTPVDMNTSKAFETLGVKPPVTGSATSYLGTAITPGTDAEVAAQISKIDTSGKAPEIQKSQQLDAQTKTNTGVSASTIEPNADVSETDLINEWINSAEGDLFMDRREFMTLTEMEKAKATKEALEAKYQSDLESLDNKLNSIGMGRSGLKATQTRALANKLAADLLGVGSDLANKLIESDFDLREAVLDGVAELMKSAKDNDKESVRRLEAMGWTINPYTGKPEKTLSARSAERADVQLEISERRLALAEDSAARAEARFQEQFGTGKSDQFNFVRQLMELNPNASIDELKSTAMENTTLTDGEISTILNTMPLAPKQMDSTAKVLVATYFKGGKGVFTTKSGDLKQAQETAKKAIGGGVIKVGNRTVNLSQEDISALEKMIDTVTVDDVEQTVELLSTSK